MLRRIGWWALGGLAVALFWLVLILIFPRGQGPGADWLIVQISVPFLPFARHVAITWYESLVLNAASYACIGLLVETIRLTVRSSVARLRH
ncbi:MAG: hypothetical protein ACLQHF_09080 [Terracidiphilus sp.]